MRYLTLLFVWLAAALSASAYEYPYLAFQTASGGITTVDVEGLTMTVENGTLSLSNASASMDLDLSQLDKMYFTTQSAGINGLTSAPCASEVEVFTTSGEAMGRYPSLNQALSSLHPGIYLFKLQGSTLKIAVK